MQKNSFSRSKMKQNVIFCMQKFFKTWHVPVFLIQNLTRFIFFQSKIWRFVKLFDQNLMRFEIFISKSDALEKLNSKSEKF